MRTTCSRFALTCRGWRLPVPRLRLVSMPHLPQCSTPSELADFTYNYPRNTLSPDPFPLAFNALKLGDQTRRHPEPQYGLDPCSYTAHNLESDLERRIVTSYCSPASSTPTGLRENKPRNLTATIRRTAASTRNGLRESQLSVIGNRSSHLSDVPSPISLALTTPWLWDADITRFISPSLQRHFDVPYEKRG